MTHNINPFDILDDFERCIGEFNVYGMSEIIVNYTVQNDYQLILRFSPNGRKEGIMMNIIVIRNQLISSTGFRAHAAAKIKDFLTKARAEGKI